jgi:hypothetical protein
VGRRKRGLVTRLLIKAGAAAAHHGGKHARRAGGALVGRLGPQVQRRASEEYGGKRKAGTPIPECPVRIPADTRAADRWELSAMVGGYHIPFVTVADPDITELDSAELITLALLAACHVTHDQRPLDENWQVTQMVASNDAAIAWFGQQGYYPAHAVQER